MDDFITVCYHDLFSCALFFVCADTAVASYDYAESLFTVRQKKDNLLSDGSIVIHLCPVQQFFVVDE
jgi:hypothetical protein